jgi:putative endonuclease
MIAFSYVYMLQSDFQPDTHYVGLTDDLKSRLREHNAGRVRHTAERRPWHIRPAVAFTDRTRAADFECYLKSASGRAFAKNHF